MKDDALKIIELKNSKGVEMVVSNYGATIISLKVPDKNSNPVNVVVGLDSFRNYTDKAYQDHSLYLGCTVGRYAGRISKGHVEIEGQNYPIYHENGVHLHGGKKGFDKKIWNIESQDASSVCFSYSSDHLEEGYPGVLQVKVIYKLLPANTLKISIRATTDKTTVVNLTNHTYFNLEGSGSILDHNLQINSNRYLEVDKQKLPTGSILPTKDTIFDYQVMKQLKNSFTGLDDTFIVQDSNNAAILNSEQSGISMKVSTNQPAMVVYTPKSLPELKFSDEVGYGKFPAICFETQNFPDAPHHASFPSCLLAPGAIYKNETEYAFTID